MKKAFTLIELSIIILIIGILVAGITSSSIIARKIRLSSAQSLSESSPVPATQNLIAWYDAANDSAFSSKDLSDGEVIATWFDLNPISSVRYNLTQASSTRRPTYISEAINGLPAVRLDGTDDYLEANELGVFYGYEMTLFFVFTPTFTAGNSFHENIFGFYLNGTNKLLVPFAATTDNLWYSNAGSSVNVNYATALKDKPTLMVARIYGNSIGTGDIYLNGVAIISGQVVDQTGGANQFVIGQDWDNSTASDFLAANMGEIIIYNRALTDDELEDIEQYLSDKWKLGLSI